MVSAMRKKKRWERLIDPSSPNYKMFCYQGWETRNLSIHVLVNLLDQPWFVFTSVHTWYMSPGETQILSHQKSDAICTCFGSWLKEERFLSCSVERKKCLWPLLPLCHPGSWQHPWLLRRAWFPCPHLYPWPLHSLGFDHHLCRILGNAWRVESLRFPQNSRICKWGRTTPPNVSYIDGKI